VEGAFTSSAGAQPEQRLRPLGLGEILDAAIKLYSNNAVTLWKIVAVVIIPVGILNQVVVGLSIPSDSYVHNGTLYTYSGHLNNAAGIVAAVVLTVLAVLIANGALSLSLVDAYIGQPLDWRASLREAGGRLGGLLWLSILFSVLVFLGFVALILPGIYLLVIWSVAVPALMFEHVGGFKALGRSFDLVRGRWWPTFALHLVWIVMLAVLFAVVGVIFRAIQSGLHVDSVGVWLVLNWLSGLVADLIGYPFIAAVIAVLYIDLRVRKEALDLELLANQLGRSGGEAPRPTAASTEPGWPPAG
jgi:hypothetical protein